MRNNRTLVLLVLTLVTAGSSILYLVLRPAAERVEPRPAIDFGTATGGGSVTATLPEVESPVPDRTAIESSPGTGPADSLVEGEPTRGVLLRVIDKLARPIADAEVQVTTDSGAARYRTSSDGTCLLQLPPGAERFELHVEKPGYFHFHRFRQVSDKWPIRLAAATTLFGRVLNGDTGDVAPGATIVYPHGWCQECPGQQVLADAQGSYELPGIPRNQEVTFELAAPALADEVETFTIREESDRVQHDFVLTAGVELRSEVVSYLLGTPVAGAEVRIQPHAFVTDEAGRFGARIQPSAALTFATIEIRAAGYCFTQVPFPAEELAEGNPIRLRLPECAFIDGQVADAAGNAIIGAELRTRTNSAMLKSRRQQGEELDRRHGLDLPAGSSLGNEPGWWRCKSDQEGRFRLGGLAPGNPALLLEVKASGCEPKIIELPSTTRPGGTSWLDVVLTELPASETSHLSGLVTVNGEATAAYLRWRGQMRSGSCSVESDGRYEIPDLERGEVELSVGLDTSAWSAPLCEGAVVQLTIDDQSAVHDFDLWPRVGTISGHVVYEDGRPAPGFEVDVECDEVEFGVSGPNRPDGSYSFKVPDGGRSFSVSVHCLGEVYCHPEVLPGSENVDFVLPSLGKILLLIRDARTKEIVPHFSVGWRPAGERDFRQTELRSWRSSNPDGRFETRVPVGSIDLVVRAQPLGYLAGLLSGIQVKPEGEGTPVDVDLEPGIDAHFELAPEQEPIPADHFVYLLEPEAWEEVRSVVEKERFWEILGSRFTGSSIAYVHLSFDDDRTATIRGLVPGAYRLCVVPADVVISPAQIEVREGEHEPTTVRWHWK